MDEKQIYNVIQDSIDGLFRSELITERITINNETVLLGKGSVLDSIAFITLFSEVEDRLSEKSGKEIFIDFNKLHDFNTEKSHLSAGTLINYISNLLDSSK